MEVLNPAVQALQREALEDPDGLWARAAEQLPWFRRWDRVLDWEPPTFRWFAGATTNLAYNCLDHHVDRGRAGHAALISYDERGNRRVDTYAQLLAEVERIAAALRGMGIRKGDRVAIYMPTCPEAIALMLASVRIGAIHLVVFAGFGSGALADRIRLAGAKALFTADVTWRKGAEVQLEHIANAALDCDCPTLDRVVVLRRSATPAPARSATHLDWETFLELGKGIDPGWVVGHSYIVYGPLLAGCATLVYEGALDHPGPDTLYRIVDENRVSGIFTSPTAVRLLMRYGTQVARRHDLDSIERVVCAGEVLNPPAWEWLQKQVLGDRVPVLDHMWQTETSGPIIANPYGLALLPIKPGSSGIMLPGIDGAVMTPEGQVCKPGEKGIFVIRRPFPGLTASLWGEPERYGRDYWQRVPGQTVYFSGDAASLDDDGYVWFSGRADEIIKIAAHRLGTIEVETAFLRHPAVAEAGVTGRPDELRGEVISAFIALKQGHEPSEQLRAELLETVRRELGPVAVIGELNFVGTLPKTRSGKIMRRVLKAVTLGSEPGDISTIEDEASVEEARAAWEQMRQELGDRQATGP